MVAPSQHRGYLLLALLVIAQLFAVAHSAEHGAGQHSHENVVCYAGAINDDDVVLATPLVSPKPAAESLALRPRTGAGVPLHHAILRPPATGPPVFS